MSTPTDPNSSREIPLLDRIRASTAGRYTIHAELGAGGMATVFRATEIALEREVAIKVMSAEMVTVPGAFERFRREARVAAALSHPHIVPIYAIGEDPSLAYFAMKFIEGKGLDAVLKKEGAQPVEATVRTIATVARALAHAHERGVVHRDVKPANIMIGTDGWVYVTDFGIAKRDDAHQLTQAGTVIGTPAYMSPEQFNGLPVTGAADQYSLGVVAYEMLAGRAPFDGPSLGEVMRGHLLEEPPPLRTLRIDVPVPVADVVTRMLAKEPGDRFASLGEAAQALDAAGASLKGAPTRRVAPPPAPISTMSPTTPIPRSRSGSITAESGQRPITREERAVAEPARSSAGGWLVALLVIGALGGGGWYALRDRFAASPAATSTAILPPADTIPTVATDSSDTTSAGADPTTDTLAAASVPSAPDTARAPASYDDAMAAFSARLAAAPSIDRIAPAESVVVRIGSQTLETVLFVNGTQVGIVGGRGLLSVTVPPGQVSASVKRLNCRDWDTTFTALAGRRYTFVERSPTC